MSQIFDRLNNLFKSFFNESSDFQDKTDSRRFFDDDDQQAWEELDDFLNSDDPKDKQTRSNRQYDYSQTNRDSSHSSTVDPELKKAFETLEVPFGSSPEVVKKAYKNLLGKYHPDKHANDPEKLKYATEITKKINNAVLKIKNYYKNR